MWNSGNVLKPTGAMRGACPPLPGSEVHAPRAVCGDLPAIATHVGIEAARCVWRWQAGGRQAESENTSEAVEDLPIWPGADIPGTQIED